MTSVVVHKDPRLFSSLLSLLLFAFAPALSAQSRQFRFKPADVQKGGEVRWEVAEGGRVEVEKDEYAILERDVKLYYQDLTLRADKITYNLKTKDAVAEGHVVIDQGPTRVAANQAVYNLESRTGTFFGATASMDPSMYFSGERIEKIDDDTFRLTNGVLTSCDLDRPAWSFHVGSAEVTLDDYAHMRNLSFRTRGVPVFWTPVLVWPTKKERSQGFLIPRLRFANDIGDRMELGYFIPFGDSVDATIFAELNTRSYNGGGIELRYLPSQNVKLGEVRAFSIHDPESGKQQWKYQYQHAQEGLPGGFRGVIDVQDYSDLQFFQKWDSDSRLQTLSNIYSSAYLTKNRPGLSINILTDRREIFLGRTFVPESGIMELRQRFEQLPSVQFRMYPQQVASTPLYFSLESSASHLRTSGLLAGPNADYFRADFFPTLSLQLRTPPWFSIKPQISFRETYYSTTLDPNDPAGRTTVEESLHRSYAQGQVEVVGPSFSRVLNRGAGGFSKFKHVIEPRFRYIYTTNVEEQERVIRFDTVDSPFLPIVRDSLEYSFTQRLLGKEKGEGGSPREVLSLSFRQAVALSKPFPGTSFASRTNHKFTPMVATLRVNPYQSLTLDASTTIGNISHQIDQTSLSANLAGTGKRSDKYLGLTWFASYRAPGQTTGDSSQIRVNTGSNVWRDRMRADVQVSFDANRGRFLEQRYLIGVTGSCYGLSFEFRRYLVYDPNERPITDYGLVVTLKNVGTIGTR